MSFLLIVAIVVISALIVWHWIGPKATKAVDVVAQTVQTDVTTVDTTLHADVVQAVNDVVTDTNALAAETKQVAQDMAAKVETVASNIKP